MQHYIDVCSEKQVACVFEILRCFELLETPTKDPSALLLTLELSATTSVFESLEHSTLNALQLPSGMGSVDGGAPAQQPSSSSAAVGGGTSDRLLLDGNDFDCLVESLRRMNADASSTLTGGRGRLYQRVIYRLILCGADADALHLPMLARLLSEWKRHVSLYWANSNPLLPPVDSRHSPPPMFLGLRGCGNVDEHAVETIRSLFASCGSSSRSSSTNNNNVPSASPQPKPGSSDLPPLAIDLSCNAFPKQRNGRLSMMRSLQTLWGSYGLKHLSLAYSGGLNAVDALGGDTIVYLIDAFSNLESLSLRGNPYFFGSSGGGAAAQWLHNLHKYFSLSSSPQPSLLNAKVSIRRLDVSRMGLTDDTAAVLGDMARCYPTLEVIAARRNHFTNAGFSSFADVLVSPECRLRELYLGHQTPPPLGGGNPVKSASGGGGSMMSRLATGHSLLSTLDSGSSVSLYSRTRKAPVAAAEAPPASLVAGASVNYHAAATTILVALGGNTSLAVCDLTGLPLDDPNGSTFVAEGKKVSPPPFMILSALTDLILNTRSLVTVFISYPSMVQTPMRRELRRNTPQQQQPAAGGSVATSSPARQLLYSPRGGPLDQFQQPPMKFTSTPPTAGSGALPKERSSSAASSNHSYCSNSAADGDAHDASMALSAGLLFEEYIKGVNSNRLQRRLYNITLRDEVKDEELFVLERFVGASPEVPPCPVAAPSSGVPSSRRVSPRSAASPLQRTNSGGSLSQKVGKQSSRRSSVSSIVPTATAEPPASKSAHVPATHHPPVPKITACASTDDIQFASADSSRSPSEVPTTLRPQPFGAETKSAVMSTAWRLPFNHLDSLMDHFLAAAEEKQVLYVNLISAALAKSTKAIKQQVDSQSRIVREQEKYLQAELARLMEERRLIDNFPEIQKRLQVLEGEHRHMKGELEDTRRQISYERLRHDEEMALQKKRLLGLTASGEAGSGKVPNPAIPALDMRSESRRENKERFCVAEKAVVVPTEDEADEFDEEEELKQQQKCEVSNEGPSVDGGQLKQSREPSHEPVTPFENLHDGSFPQPSNRSRSDGSSSRSPSPTSAEPLHIVPIPLHSPSSPEQAAPVLRSDAVPPVNLSVTPFDIVLSRHNRFAAAMKALTPSELASVKTMWAQGIRSNASNSTSQRQQRRPSQTMEPHRLALASFIAQCQEQKLFDTATLPPTIPVTIVSSPFPAPVQKAPSSPPTSTYQRTDPKYYYSELETPTGEGFALAAEVSRALGVLSQPAPSGLSPQPLRSNAKPASSSTALAVRSLDMKQQLHDSPRAVAAEPASEYSTPVPTLRLGSTATGGAPPAVADGFLERKETPNSRAKDITPRPKSMHHQLSAAPKIDSTSLRKKCDAVRRCDDELRETQRRFTAQKGSGGAVLRSPHKKSPRQTTVVGAKPVSPPPPPLALGAGATHRRVGEESVTGSATLSDGATSGVPSQREAPSAPTPLKSSASLKAILHALDIADDEGESGQRNGTNDTASDAVLYVQPTTSRSVSSVQNTLHADDDDETDEGVRVAIREHQRHFSGDDQDEDGGVHHTGDETMKGGTHGGALPETKLRDETSPGALEDSRHDVYSEGSSASSIDFEDDYAMLPDDEGGEHNRLHPPHHHASIGGHHSHGLAADSTGDHHFFYVETQPSIELISEDCHETQSIKFDVEGTYQPPERRVAGHDDERDDSLASSVEFDIEESSAGMGSDAVGGSTPGIASGGALTPSRVGTTPKGGKVRRSRSNPAGVQQPAAAHHRDDDPFVDGSILNSPLGAKTASKAASVARRVDMDEVKEFVSTRIMPQSLGELIFTYPKFSSAMSTLSVEEYESFLKSWNVRYRYGQQRRLEELEEVMIRCTLNDLFV